MKVEIDKIISLQNVETEINIIKRMVDGVPDILKSIDIKLQDSEKNLENDMSLLNELKKKYRVYDSEVKVNLSQISKSQEKLFAVKNNKEYQAILKEIDDVKEKNSKIEDQMIEDLDEIEKKEKSVSSKKLEIAQLKAQSAKEKEKIQHEMEEGKQRLKTLNSEWDNISKSIDNQLLKKYLWIREQVSGKAVAPVKSSVCLGCNMNIPPQLFNELQRGDGLKLCPHCQRIIYWQQI